MPIYRIVLFSLWWIAQSICFAQATGDSPSEILRDRSAQAHLRYEKHEYKAAAAIYEVLSSDAQIKALPAWKEELYNFACYESMSGDTEKALGLLQEATVSGMTPGLDAVANDTDLAPLRSSPSFHELLSQIKQNSALWTDSSAIATHFSSTLTDEEKSAGLSKFWAEARFNFAFFSRLPDLDWDALYLEYLTKVKATKTTADYYFILSAFAAALHDGHTDVTVPKELFNTFYARPGFRTQLVENRVIITSISNPEVSALGVQVGDEIVSVDGLPVKQYAETNVGPYISSSTPQDREIRLYDYHLLSGPAQRVLKLTLSDATRGTRSVTVPRIPIERRTPRKDTASFKVLPNGIAYLRVDEFEDNRGAEVLLDNFQALSSSSALIIDVRANGGGSSDFGYNILRMVAQHPFQSSAWKTRDYKAANRAWGNTPGWFHGMPEDELPDLRHNFAKPVAVLIGAHTFSAAEDFVAAFHGMHRGILVGQRTGGSTGQPLVFGLPGGGSARVCTKDDTAPDGTSFEGIGFVPDFLAELTVADVRSGKDSTIDMAVQHLRDE